MLHMICTFFRNHYIIAFFNCIFIFFVNIFKKVDSNTNTLDISIPANIYTQGPSIDILKNKWWLMSGDMDYV
jgi:hypothetical protein